MNPRLRDLSNEEKQDTVRLQKQADRLSSENSLLAKDKERLQEEVELLQEELIELKEHVSGSGHESARHLDQQESYPKTFNFAMRQFIQTASREMLGF